MRSLDAPDIVTRKSTPYLELGSGVGVQDCFSVPSNVPRVPNEVTLGLI
jgi:hypothetical protein